MDSDALPDLEAPDLDRISDFWRRPAFYKCGLLLSAVLLLYWYCLGFVWHRVIDDGGISFAYAKHLVEGWGLVAVPGGQNVEAYSNFLWVVLLAVPKLLGLAIPAASKWLGAFLGLVAILGAVRLVQRFEDRAWHEIEMSDAVAPLLVCLAPGFVAWMPSGLENALYAALLVALVLLDLREREDPERFPFTGLVAVGLALTRPEGLAFGGIVGAFKLVDAIREPAYRRQFLQFLGAYLGPMLLYHVWHYLYFERLLPNTYYAKDPGTGWDQATQGWNYFEKRIYSEGWVYVAPLAAFAALYHWRRAALTCAVLAFNVAFILVAGGDWMGLGRFVSFTIPLYAALVQAGISQFGAFWRTATEDGRGGPAAAAVGLGALVAIALWWGSPRHSKLQSIDESDWCHFCKVREYAAELKANAADLGRPVTTVLTHDFGGFAWESTRRFHPIDFLGLADVVLARAKSYREPDSTVQKRHSYQYVFHEWGDAPGIIYIPKSWWGRLHRSPEFRWSYHSIDRGRFDRELYAGDTLAMHRSTWVDLYPDVRSLEGVERVGNLRVLDAYRRSPVRPGERVTVRFALAPTEDEPVEDPLRWKLRAKDGDRRVTFEDQRLFERYPPMLKDWRAGEPVARRATVEVPAEFGNDAALELGLRVADEWRWVPIRGVEGDAEVSSDMLRFPDNLPGSNHPELAPLRRDVASLQARRWREQDMTLRDPELASDCSELGARLESSGRPEAAYLAYVLAFRADRKRAVRLAPKLWDLRTIQTNVRFTEQYALLRRLYRTGRIEWGLRLAEWYAYRGYDLAGQYVVERLPETPKEDVDLSSYRSRLEEVRRRLEEGGSGSSDDTGPAPPFEEIPGVDGGFESDEWSGWKRVGDAFTKRPHEVRLDRSEPIRGHRGAKIATSYERKKDEGTGRLISKAFRLDAPALMFLIGGGDRVAGVQLVVDGEVVRETNSENRTVAMTPVLWDVREFQGERVELRVVDDSAQGWGHVLADGFRLVR